MKIYKIIATCMFLIGFQANANLITINVDNNAVAVGETINVSLFANFTDSVDTIDFNFDFNNSLFSFIDNSETTGLPNDGFLNFFSAASNPAGLGLGFLSFDQTVTGEFLFASFSLQRTQLGDSEFSLTSNFFADALTGDSFTLDPVKSVSVTSKVPAPETLGLFAMAGLVLLNFRVNKK